MSEVALNIEESPSVKEEYKIVQIKDVVKKITGGCSTKKSDYFDEGVLVLNKGHIKTYGRVILGKHKRYVIEDYADENPSKIIDINTVLVTLRDLSVKADFLGLIGIYRGASKAIITQGMYALELHDNIDAKYLFYFSNSPAYRVYVKRTKVGSTQVHLRNGHFLDASLPLPSIEQQKRIVAKIEELFSHIDAGIAALNKAKQLLKQYRQSVLKAAVTGELTKQWREDRLKDDVQGSTSAAGAGSAGAAKLEPASQLLERILQERRQKWEAQQLEQFKVKGKVPKDDKWKGKYKEPVIPDDLFFSDIPESWCVASIDHLACDVRYGSSSKTNDDQTGVPILRMGNIVDGGLDYTKLKYLPKGHKEFPHLLLDDGDLVFNRTNSAELVGKTAVYRNVGKDTSLASYLIRLRLISGMEPDYIAFIINSAIGKAWIKSCVSQNVGQANVNGTKLKAFVVPVAPSEEQEEIVRLVKEKYDSSQRLIDEVEVQLIKAEKNKQSILASAFLGNLGE
jgi:type I restriction enzyme S subunit